MEISQVTANVTNFFQTHQLISIAALVVALFFFYQSPKESFKFVVFLAIMAIVGYFVLQLGSVTDSGMSAIGESTHKTKKALGD
ncbi:MAG: hypothetical protein PHH28_02450 [Desulfuromonadaceae bacterium]|nr:hypothetical protein [Desulfuromonadaceae bacterium]